MGSANINSKTYQFHLSQYAPSGEYTVYTIKTYKTIGEWGYIYDQYVYGWQLTFSLGNGQKLLVSNVNDNYAAGEPIKIKISLNSVPQNPIYFEVSKRGVVSLQSFIPTANSFEILLNNTDYLAPKITILLLTILPNGVILEFYKVINI